MEDVEIIAEHACKMLFTKKDMKGMRVMVTAGPSREALDPVRYISNRSSGKMAMPSHRRRRDEARRLRC